MHDGALGIHPKRIPAIRTRPLTRACVRRPIETWKGGLFGEAHLFGFGRNDRRRSFRICGINNLQTELTDFGQTPLAARGRGGPAGETVLRVLVRAWGQISQVVEGSEEIKS